jgi:hypothetical protein
MYTGRTESCTFVATRYSQGRRGSVLCSQLAHNKYAQKMELEVQTDYMLSLVARAVLIDYESIYRVL